jgi:hypothetical protein
MEHDDPQVVRQCRRPTRLQLSLKAVRPCTESFDTPYIAVAQTWTLSCGASFPPPWGPSPQHKLVGESLGNQCMRNLGLDVKVASDQPHDTSHFP